MKSLKTSIIPFLTILILFPPLPPATAVSTDGLLCTEDFCQNYIEDEGCSEVDIACLAQNSTHNGRLLPSPTVCNCCEFCLVNLREDDYCSVGTPGSPLPRSICGPGLYCTPPGVGEVHAVCKPMDATSDCYRERNAVIRDRDADLVGALKPLPRCDGDGLYQAVVCVPGQTCFCVDENGKRIFGEAPHRPGVEMEMHCECARLAARARSLGLDDPNLLTSRCDSRGSYEELQCLEGWCFCVDAHSGMLTEEPRNNSLSIEQLPCYDKDAGNAQLDFSECEKLLLGLNETLTRQICQPDGGFAAVQEKGEKMFCSDAGGKQIEQFVVDKAEAEDMNCNCARTRKLLLEAKALEVPECERNGSFKKFACRRGLCYCINENGIQTSREVSKEQICTLTCCKKDESDCGCKI